MDGTDGMDRDGDLDRRVAAAAMRIAAERGWRRTGAIDVARAAELPLTTVYRRYPTRPDLLAAVSRVADETVLAEETATIEGETARDRLFDVMMRRFDALLPFRDGLAAVLRDLPREPLTGIAFSRQFGRSMQWMLRAAGVEADSCAGGIKAVGLGALHLRVLRVWLADDTADLARTMAALDAELRRAESWANTLFRRRGGGARTEEPEPSPAV